MKLSKYNVFVKRNGKYYIYNTLFSTLTETLKEDWELLKANKIPADNKEYVKSKIILKDDFNELEKIKSTYLKQQKKSDTLIVTLALTLACNFACPYCYENRDNRVISKQQQKEFLSFVEAQFKTGRYKRLFITWFGGEPLIALDTIMYLNKKLNELCEIYNIQKLAFMSTNGYLINSKNINKIVDLNLTDCYITIDGGKESHNKTRILHNGEGTFDVIINNLKLMAKNNVPYSIRINVNKTNQNNANNLLGELKQNNVPFNRIFLGHIQSFTSSCKDCECVLTKKEFAKINFDFNKKANQFQDLPYRRWTHCRAELESNYVFDPALNGYQCENDLGREEKRVGYINTEGKFVKEKNNPYILWNPFEYKKCKNCSALPICLGGCPFMGLKEKKPQCRAEKYVLKNIISRYIKENNL